MNSDAKRNVSIQPAPEARPGLCPSCTKIVEEYRRTGLPLSPWIDCAYGHRIIDYPHNNPAPERIPVWAWTNPITERKGSA